jgi:hypothetical protein
MSKHWPLLIVLAASAAGAGTLRIDFGTETSPVREGWLRVTHKTKFPEDTPVRWPSTVDLVSRDNPVPRDWKLNPSRGRKYPPPIYTTDLRQDCVQSGGDATLALRLPDGDYRIWLLCGSAGGSRNQVWDTHVSFGISPFEPVDPEHPSLLEKLVDFTRDEGTFAGPYACRVLTGEATAEGGSHRLRLSTRSRWVINAMIVAPEDQWEKVKATEIAKIEQELFLLPDDVLADWKHTPHEDDTSMPEPTEVEKKRGFLIYHRPYLSPVWPNTVPRREECEPTVRAFASRDEYEPLTFTLFPLRDFTELEVEVSDLRRSDGHTIPQERIVLPYVRYMNVRPNYSSHGVYYRAPDVLMPFRGPQALVKGENFRVWLTVHVDAFAPPGVYRGKARVSGDGWAAASVSIAFRVLPIKLQKDRSLVYGTYYRHPYDRARRAPDAFSREWWRRKAELEHRDMAAHGLNALVSGIWGTMDDEGRWHLDFDLLGVKIDLCRRHGLTKPVICHIPTSYIYRKYMDASMGSHLRLLKMPPQGFFDDLTRCVEAIETERQRRQWPELLYYPIDEPSRSELAVRFMVKVLKAIKRVPGVRTYVTADPAHEAFAPMKPHVDVWCCQPFTFPREQILADMKERGVEYWCYPNHIAGENDHTPVAGARMTYGFGFWRSGFRALTPWIYQSNVSDPWNYLDGGYMDFFNRTDDQGRPIPVTLWEAYREGIDDGRYITTLERAIARAREAGLTQLADDAQAELQGVWDAIEVQEKYKYDGLWDPAMFDRYRWLIARQILRLQEAMER